MRQNFDEFWFIKILISHLKTIAERFYMVYNTRKKNDTLQFRIMITKIMERVKIQLWDPGPYHVSAKKRN